MLQLVINGISITKKLKNMILNKTVKIYFCLKVPENVKAKFTKFAVPKWSLIRNLCSTRNQRTSRNARYCQLYSVLVC